MMRRSRSVIGAGLGALASLVLFNRLVLAHPGHGTSDPSGLPHYVTEPVHLVPLVIVAGAVVLCACVWVKSRQHR